MPQSCCGIHQQYFGTVLDRLDGQLYCRIRLDYGIKYLLFWTIGPMMGSTLKQVYCKQVLKETNTVTNANSWIFKSTINRLAGRQKNRLLDLLDSEQVFRHLFSTSLYLISCYDVLIFSLWSDFFFFSYIPGVKLYVTSPSWKESHSAPVIVVETHPVGLVWLVSPSRASLPITCLEAGLCTNHRLFSLLHFLFLVIPGMVVLPVWKFTAAFGRNWWSSSTTSVDWTGTRVHFLCPNYESFI